MSVNDLKEKFRGQQRRASIMARSGLVKPLHRESEFLLAAA
jgi:hypothetical protein